MKTLSRLSWLLIFLFVSFYSMSQDKITEATVIQIKLRESYSAHVTATRIPSNKFGIPEIDKVSTELGIRNIRRIFRESGNFERAHKRFGLHLWYELEFAAGTSVMNLLKKYKELPQFEIVESRQSYNRIEPVASSLQHIKTTITNPVNDPLFNQQWHYENTGQTNGTPGADVSLADAWTIQTGKPEVIVAVIDGGIDVSHPDLAGSMWINTDEIANNSVDDDGNGYVDDIYGYGFGDNTGRIYPDDHGTHVGGTIAAITNNGIGVSGIAGGSGTADGVRLMSCAGFGSWGIGGFEDAMVYAADNGAVISQNSWGGGGSAIEAAIDYFVARAGYDNSDANFDRNIQIGPMAGGIVIFAAGNSNSTYGYPASYEPVMAVASTDHNDEKSWFSNYGTWIDISAPGSDVYSTLPSQNYGAFSGTSMACPHVSGVAALIISEFGGPSLNPSVVWSRIQNSADNIDTQNSSYIGYLGSGRLNAYQAVISPDDIPPAAITDLIVTAIGSNSITLSWTAPGASNNEGKASYYNIRYSTSPINENNFNAATPVLQSTAPKIAGSTEEFQVTGLQHSTSYYFAIKTHDHYNNISPLSNIGAATTLDPPVVAVSPNALSSALFTGEQQDQTLNIANSGEGDLSWLISLTNGGSLEIDKVLENLKENHAAITSVIPNRFNFYEGETGSYISDGGNDMYDVGNYISTNLSSQVNYTNGSLSTSSAFGTPGNYFTVKFPGLFIFAADINVSTFNVSGNLGADGSGSVDGSILSLTHKAKNFKGLIKRVYNAGDPSVNHLVIVEDNGSVSHNFSSSTDSDQHNITNLTGVQRIYYLLFAGSNGSYIADTSMKELMAAFLNAINEGPEWLTVDNFSGATGEGSSEDVTVTFNANGLTGGVYHTDLIVSSNDPVTPEITLPVTLTVTGAPNIHSNKQAVDFSEGYVNGHYNSIIIISNTGTDSLKVSSVSDDSDAFSADLSSFVLLPGQERELTLTFSPQTAGSYYTDLILASNDSDSSFYPISLSGMAVLPPVIEVSPGSLTVDLFSNESTSRTLTIENTGSSILSWIMQISATDATESGIDLNSVKDSADIVTKNNNDDTTPMGAGDFSIKTPSPVSLACITADPTTGLIYGLALYGYGFFVYNPVLDTWSQLTNSPIYSSEGGGAAYLNGKIYTTYIYNNSSIGVYNIAANSWSTISNNLSIGTSNITAAGSAIYLVSSTTFKKFEPASNTWTTLSPPPFSFTSRGGLASHQNFIYGHRGSGYSSFAKYDIHSNSWTTLPNLPYSNSQNCTVDPFNGKYYTAYDNRIHIYDMQSNSWSTQYISFNTYNSGITYVNKPGVEGIYLSQGPGGTGLGRLEVDLWLQAEQHAGQVAPGESAEIQVMFNANSLFGGTYLGEISISSNDPVNPAISIPVTMNVTGRPDIAFGKSSIDFGERYSMGQYDTTLVVSNRGTDSLKVTSVSANSDGFSVNLSSFVLLPYQAQELTITFSPDTAGNYNSYLIITSNDFHSPDSVSLSGRAILPPVIEVNPTSLSADLFSNETATRTLSIENTGNSMLDWHIHINELYSTTSLSKTSGAVPLAAGDFTWKASSPVPLTCITSDPSTGFIYGQAIYGYSFYVFNPMQNTWRQLASSPVYSENVGGAACLNGKIYSTYLYNSSSIGVYDIASNTWSVITNNLSSGTSNITAAGSSIYLISSYTFKKYTPASSTWTTLASPPFSFSTRGGLACHQNTIYGHRGNGYSNFAKYDIDSNSWTTLPSLPYSASSNSTIDPFNGKYYTVYDNNIFVYEIQNNSWSNMPIPFSTYNCGITFVSRAGVSGIYVAQGYWGTGLGRLEVNQWLQSDQYAGQTAPGENVDVEVLFNSNRLLSGTYHAEIEVSSNDPVSPVVSIPVTLQVSGIPDISVPYENFNFPETYVETQKDSVLTVTNNGTDTLMVSSLTVNDTHFSVDVSSFSLAPYEHQDIRISFEPNDDVPYHTLLTISCNDPEQPEITVPLSGNGVLPPEMSVTPASIHASLLSYEQEQRTITITNNGGSNLSWHAQTEGQYDLESVHTNLLDNFSSITDLIPGMYSFQEGATGSYIGDGGGDMYDGGNYILADGNLMPYTNGAINNSISLGTSARYFTAKVQGLFVLAADDIDISTFEINGDLGADGSGNVDGHVLTLSRAGRTYKGFIKRVYNAYDPSVNHLVIVQDNSTVTHAFPSHTGTDEHTVSNLSGVTRLYYLLFAAANGGYVDNSAMEGIMSEFLNSINEEAWLSIDQTDGTVGDGSSLQIGVTINAEGLSDGVYEADVIISGNDPFTPDITVPVTLSVTEVHPAMSVTGSIVTSIVTGETQTQKLTISNSGQGQLSWGTQIKGTANDLEDIQLRLGSNFTKVTEKIKNKFDFEGGSEGYYISNGGNNMYEWGNYMQINWTPMAYTNGEIVSLSQNIKYFTSKSPGLFVLAADVDSFTDFSISGYLGNSGSGTVEGHIDTVRNRGKTFHGFMKRVYDTDGPSVNHIIILENKGNVSHYIPSSSYYDDHYIQNHGELSRRIYYLLFAGADGFYYDNASMENIMKAFLNAIGEGESWLTINKANGMLSQSASEDVTVHISAEHLQPGYYEGRLITSGNDIFNPSDTSLVRLTVTSNVVPPQPKPITNLADELPNMDFKNHPNPFTEETTFSYTLTKNAHIKLVVKDVRGTTLKTLIDEPQDTGNKEIVYNASQIAQGMYFCYLIADEKIISVYKMIKL